MNSFHSSPYPTLVSSSTMSMPSPLSRAARSRTHARSSREYEMNTLGGVDVVAHIAMDPHAQAGGQPWPALQAKANPLPVLCLEDRGHSQRVPLKRPWIRLVGTRIMLLVICRAPGRIGPFSRIANCCGP